MTSRRLYLALGSCVSLFSMLGCGSIDQPYAKENSTAPIPMTSTDVATTPGGESGSDVLAPERVEDPAPAPRIPRFATSADLLPIMPPGYVADPRLQDDPSGALRIFISPTYGTDPHRSEVDQTITLRTGDEIPLDYTTPSSSSSVVLRCATSDTGDIRAYMSAPEDGINEAVTLAAPGWSVQVAGHYVDREVIEDVANELVCAAMA